MTSHRELPVDVGDYGVTSNSRDKAGAQQSPCRFTDTSKIIFQKTRQQATPTASRDVTACYQSDSSHMSNNSLDTTHRAVTSALRQWAGEMASYPVKRSSWDYVRSDWRQRETRDSSSTVQQCRRGRPTRSSTQLQSSWRPCPVAASPDSHVTCDNTTRAQQDKRRHGAEGPRGSSAAGPLYAWTADLVTASSSGSGGISSSSSGGGKRMHKSATFCGSRTVEDNKSTVQRPPTGSKMDSHTTAAAAAAASRPRSAGPSRPSQSAHSVNTANTVTDNSFDFVDMRAVCRANIAPSDVTRIGMFYGSNQTEVFACACAARLYL